jgi:hypothetical protein
MRWSKSSSAEERVVPRLLTVRLRRSAGRTHAFSTQAHFLSKAIEREGL